MEKHITLVAALNIGYGILGILIGLFIFLAVVGGGLMTGDHEAIAITSIVGTSIATVIILFSVPEIIGGIALLKRKSWARILLLIIACLDLIEFPIGTAIGIYTLWVLLQDETVKLLNEGGGKKTEIMDQ